MILNPGSLADAHPKRADDPAQPYVMWPGTLYEHVMVPVR
jgi:hypothetical protein